MVRYGSASQREAMSSSGMLDAWHASRQTAESRTNVVAASATTATIARVRRNRTSTPRAADTAEMLGAREIYSVTSRKFDRIGIPRIGMSHHARPRVGREHAAQLLSPEGRAVRDDDHPGVDRVPDAHTTTVMHGHPRRSGGRVHECVQHRPVRDRIAPVAHVFGLAIWRGDRARVEMVAPDHDRGAYLASRDQIVYALAELGALAIAKPAHPCRESLIGHALAGESDPPRESAVLRKKLEDEPVGAPDVRGIAGESDPAERAASFREERTDISGHEPRVAERIRVPRRQRLAAQVVPVVEGDGTL